jgi:hypothetical protein
VRNRIAQRHPNSREKISYIQWNSYSRSWHFCPNRATSPVVQRWFFLRANEASLNFHFPTWTPEYKNMLKYIYFINYKIKYIKNYFVNSLKPALMWLFNISGEIQSLNLHGFYCAVCCISYVTVHTETHSVMFLKLSGCIYNCPRNLPY